MQTGKLRGGVCEIELKPPLGLVMGDGAWQSKGFLTPLYVKALVLANGDDQVAIVTLDATGMDRPDTAQAAELISQRCGIPASGAAIICSHTHVAPSMRPSVHIGRETFNPYWNAEAKERERAWVNEVIANIVKAVSEAQARLQEASIGVATAELPWLIFNRRRHTRNYGIWTHWMKIPRDQAYQPEGPIDPDFGLFVVRGADHRPICMVWNFSGHNSFNFGDQYSGDLAYTVQAALDERVGEHIPCLYTPGCGANTNYFDYGQPGGLEKATDGVASAIVAIYREACTLPDVRLGSRKAELFLAQRDVSRYWWVHDIHTKLPAWDGFGLKVVERRQAEAKDVATAQFDVTALRLGEAALVGLPGEFFVEFGLMIKERSPFRRTYVTTYTNGHAGYVATRQAFIGGSYEVWPVLASRIGREGGYLMVDKAIELLEELYAQ
jgi:neutral ceramidase